MCKGLSETEARTSHAVVFVGRGRAPMRAEHHAVKARARV